MSDKCPLCGRDAAVKQVAELAACESVNCPLCERFLIVDSFFRDQENWGEENLHKIACIMQDFRIRGLETRWLLLAKKHYNENDRNFGVFKRIAIEDVLDKYPQSRLELLKRAFFNLTTFQKHPGDAINLWHVQPEQLFCQNDQQKNGIIDEFKANGWVRVEYLSRSDISCQITTKGFEYIESHEKYVRGKPQGFVAMWFDSSMDDYYENGFKPAIESAIHIPRYTALRIDHKQHNNKICEEIVEEIKESRFVVADLSGHRGGVYYEAGYAQGFGKPIIWCVHEDHKDDAHFDIRQYNRIEYKTPQELKEKLEQRIKETIKD